MTEKCCKTCKHRLGDKGDEMELRDKKAKFGFKIYSNCARFNDLATFLFDPDSRVGTRIAIRPERCCDMYEACNDISDEYVPIPIDKVQHTPVDFTEPRPSIYADVQEKDEEPVIVKPDVPEPAVVTQDTQPPMPTFDDIPDYDTDDIPF